MVHVKHGSSAYFTTTDCSHELCNLATDDHRQVKFFYCLSANVADHQKLTVQYYFQSSTEKLLSCWLQSNGLLIQIFKKDKTLNRIFWLKHV